MERRTDRQESGQQSRRVGNLYDRLQEARAQRAKILSTPKPANSSSPAPRKVVPTRVRPTDKPPGRERLPRLAPIVPETPVAPEPELDLTPIRRRRRKPVRWLRWHLVFMAIVSLAFFGLDAVRPQSTFSPIAAFDPMLAPQEDTVASLPAISPAPIRSNSQILAIASFDALPTVPDALLRPSVESATGDTVAQLLIPRLRPPQNPRSEAIVERLEPLSLAVPTLEESATALTGEVRLNLRPSINLPRTTAPEIEGDVRTRIEQLGLPWSEPRLFSFNVNTTQVRFFHETDRADATLLAEAMGGVARDFTNFRPLPPEGRVELWMADRAPERAAPQEEASVFNGVRRDLRQFGSNLQDAIRSIGR